MRNFYARCTPWGTIQQGDLMYRLSPSEREAVIAHEQGHIYHKHAKKRLLWVLTLRAVFQPEKFFAMCEAQELEADRFAAWMGHREGLSSFLWRLSPRVKSPGYPTNKARLEALNV